MEFRVKDFMSKDIKSMLPDMNAKDALKMLLETGMSGLPIIDKDDNIIGVFTEKEVLKAILPAYIKAVGTFVYAEDSKAELRKIANLDKFLVKELMRREVSIIDENSSLAEASRIMLTKSERRILVVKDKKPVGIITRSDVVKGLAEKAGVAF